MKKTLLFLTGSLLYTGLQAQEPADALRLSWNNPGATARILAVGGAMGSLGGDITATFVNPAGLGFYRTGDFVFTPQFNFNRTKATYLGREEEKAYNRFQLGTSGFVWGTSELSGKVKSAAISLAYNRSADFNQHFLYRGLNTKSSYSQKYLEEIQNSGLRDDRVASNFPFGTSQAVNTYWIDTVAGGSPGNYNFQSRSARLLPTGLLQQDSVRSWGGIHEFALGVAVNLNDKLFIGGSFGLPLLHYRRESEFVEADATDNGNNNFEDAIVRESMTQTGYGLNLKLGLIYKPAEYWRLGLAFHSPTYFRITDRNQVTITTNTEGYRGIQTQSIADIPGASPEFKYVLITPYRVTGSISYVLREIEDVTKQRGFITADVEYVNYRASSYSTDGDVTYAPGTEDYLKSLNRAIDNAYKGAFNFRAGAELKFTTVMVRLGAAYLGNPYKDIRGESGERINLSGGLGYRNKGFFVDLTYVHALNRDVNFAYRLQNGDYSGANLNNVRGNVVATVGFKF
jgi:hypothetical protein